eukprot:gene18900-6262_t
MGKKVKACKPGPQIRSRQKESRKKGLTEARAVKYPSIPLKDFDDTALNEASRRILSERIPRALRPVTASMYEAARDRLGRYAKELNFSYLWGDVNAIIFTMEKWFQSDKGPATWNAALAQEAWIQKLSVIPRPSSHPAVQALMQAAREEWARHAELIRPSVSLEEFHKLKTWARSYEKIQDHTHFELYLDLTWIFGMRISEVLRLKPNDAQPGNNCIFLEETKTEASRRQVQVRFLPKDRVNCMNVSRRAASWGQQSLGINRFGKEVSETFIRETLMQAQY